MIRVMGQLTVDGLNKGMFLISNFNGRIEVVFID